MAVCVVFKSNEDAEDDPPDPQLVIKNEDTRAQAVTENFIAILFIGQSSNAKLKLRRCSELLSGHIFKDWSYMELERKTFLCRNFLGLLLCRFVLSSLIKELVPAVNCGDHHKWRCAGKGSDEVNAET